MFGNVFPHSEPPKTIFRIDDSFMLDLLIQILLDAENIRSGLRASENMRKEERESQKE